MTIKNENTALKDTVEAMRARFLAGELTVPRRLQLLKALLKEVDARERDIYAALKADFNKCEFDVLTTEISLVKAEIRHFLKHLRGYAKPRKVRTSIMSFPSKGYVHAEGYGVVLVIAPWNYPFQLALVPLVGAIAAGNYVMLKPSSRTACTAQLIGEIVEKVFDGEAVVTTSRAVLEEKYDYIFFTGGEQTGKRVLEAAAKNFTPVSLEMGGKSPCIVDGSADLKTAARRIAWGKYVNAGQTCVAPDYLLLHNSVREEFLTLFKRAIREMYYDENGLSSEFAHLCDESKAEQMRAVLSGARIIEGGGIEGRIMQPTVIEADYGDECMASELFAPVLPVLPFDDLEKVIEDINSRPRPLALYYFGKDYRKVIERAKYGGGCINDTVMHVAEGALPFGGIGASGMGRYHERASFDTFTHYKSVLIKGRMDMKMRYAPHTEKHSKFLRRFI